MRTTIDLPDSLLGRVKRHLAGRKLTLRALVIEALEAALQKEAGPFELRDASVGEPGGTPVSPEAVNDAIDARIAWCCLSHGVRELWTVDRDFSRFPQLTARNPLLAK